jgi:hypothetical protein
MRERGKETRGLNEADAATVGRTLHSKEPVPSVSPGVQERQQPAHDTASLAKERWQRKMNSTLSLPGSQPPASVLGRESCLWSLCWLTGILHLSQVPGKYQLELSHFPGNAN